MAKNIEDEHLCYLPIQAAKAMNVGKETIYNWIKTDRSFPCFKVGNKTLIPIDVLKEWIRKKAKLRVGVNDINHSEILEIIRKNRESNPWNKK